MENKIYAVQCDLFPRNKIIEILKNNDFSFFPNSPKEGGNGDKYLSFNEDRMCFVDKVIVVKNVDFNMVVGCIYRDNMNESAFRIYFPCQTKSNGFNYNPEFSKRLVVNKDFDLKTICPIVSINLNKKNIDNLINEKDITFMNVEKKTSKTFKPVNFEEAKRNGVERLFLYKREDFFIVIGLVMQGGKHKHTVMYNRGFTDFLMQTDSVNLEVPADQHKKRNGKDSNKKNSLEKGSEYRQNGVLGLNYNPNPEDDILINSFKYEPEAKVKVKVPMPYNVEDRRELWLDKTPNIEKINAILEKISSCGLESLSIEEVAYLKRFP
jgi:hypothetical protein